MNQNKLQTLVLTALVAAICVIGSYIKVPFPAPINTAALDSAPAFVSVAFLPPIYSGFAGLIGHFATGLTSGFPLGPFHLLIAIEMFIIVYCFNVLHQNGFHIIKWIFLVLSNGILSPLPFYFIMSPAYYISIVPILLVASILNALIAFIFIPIISNLYSKRKVRNL